MCGCYGHLSRECKSHSQKDEGSDISVTQQSAHEPIAQPPQHLQNDQKQPSTLLYEPGAQPQKTDFTHQKNSETVTNISEINAADITEETHGDWLIVKRKARNLKATNISKNQISLDRNPHINRKGKFEKNQPTILAGVVTKNRNSHVPPTTYVAKGINSTNGRVHNKRQRHEIGNNNNVQRVITKPPTNYASQKQTHALSQDNTQGTQGEHVKTVMLGGKKIFDYSNGIKSTVKMRDISGNGSRFMLLHDENDDVVENIMVDETGATSSHHSHNASPNVHGSDLDTTQRVAETPGMTDHMTT